MKILTTSLIVLAIVGCSRSTEEESENAAYFGITSPEEFEYDQKLAETLATNALRVVKIPKTEDYNPCWNRVWRVFLATFGSRIESTTVGSDYAYQFIEWANPSGKRLYENFRLKKMPFTGSEIPVGSVVAWPRGACGYSGSGGHIEIVVSPGRACSFLCQSICTSAVPQVYVPVKKKSPGQVTNSEVAFNEGQNNTFIEPIKGKPEFVYRDPTSRPDFITSSPWSGQAGGPIATPPYGPVAMENQMPPKTVDSQCRYGRTSAGFCNISPDLNPVAPN